MHDWSMLPVLPLGLGPGLGLGLAVPLLAALLLADVGELVGAVVLLLDGAAGVPSPLPGVSDVTSMGSKSSPGPEADLTCRAGRQVSGGCFGCEFLVSRKIHKLPFPARHDFTVLVRWHWAP